MWKFGNGKMYWYGTGGRKGGDLEKYRYRVLMIESDLKSLNKCNSH